MRKVVTVLTAHALGKALAITLSAENDPTNDWDFNQILSQDEIDEKVKANETLTNSGNDNLDKDH